MKYLSICSGIEAASAAWHQFGWQPIAFAEIEPFPSAVLAHHYPNVPNLGDMTRLPEMILRGEVEAPDLLVGGTPCQAFSVAGLRNSLDDNRGQLTLTFIRIADAIDHVRRTRGEPPCIIVWENVPGVLSTSDNAFGCFLGALAGEDGQLEPSGKRWTNAGAVFGPERTIAWRILDAQYFGVAQRRRRVFVVASARDGFDPAAVLFEFDGVRRDIAPSREARQSVANCLGASPASSGSPNVGNGQGNIVGTLTARMGNNAMGAPEVDGGMYMPWPVQVAPTRTCNHEAPIAAYSIMPMNSGKDYKARVSDVAQPIGFNTRQDPDSWLDRTGPVDTHYGTQGVVQPIAFTRCDYGNDAVIDGTPTMRCGSNYSAHLAVAFAQNQRDEVRLMVAPSLTASNDPSRSPQSSEVTQQVGAVYQAAMQVRRLTPTECERLQGFPDGWTNIPWRNKPESPDGPRYKALGNSMAVPCMVWIGNRINQHDALH